jgi:amidase
VLPRTSLTVTSTGYSAIVNLLDFTAVTFPVGHIDMNLDPSSSAFAALCKEDESIHGSCMFGYFAFARIILLIPVCPDDSAAFHGAPVGLQLMCRRTEEEKALKLVEMVLQAQAQSSAFLA